MCSDDVALAISWFCTSVSVSESLKVTIGKFSTVLLAKLWPVSSPATASPELGTDSQTFQLDYRLTSATPCSCWCSFLPQKLFKKLLYQIFFWTVYVYNFLTKWNKYLRVLLNASLKNDDDIQRQVKSLYCAANKLRGTFDQCSSTVKKKFISCLLHANVCLPIVEQIPID